MAELRKALGRAGFADVRTYIASGNVLLASDEPREALSARIEELVAAEFGVSTPAIVRSAEELAAVAAGHPFGADTGPHVRLLPRGRAGDYGEERVVVAGTEAYLSFPEGIGRANLGGPRLERLLGVPGTVRNWRTVEKLVELCSTT